MRILSLLLIAIGCAMIGTSFAMVIVNIDPSAPLINSAYARNGDVISMTGGSTVTLWVRCLDPESAIYSASYKIGANTFTLQFYNKSGFVEMWTSNVAVGSVYPNGQGGVHTYTITIYNNAGLGTTESGSFSIYTTLQGTWSVNTITITSPTQVIYATSMTVQFLFQKTSGIDDSKITCTVKEDSATLVTLAKVPAGSEWYGTYTFSIGGPHTLSLVASDGTNSIIMSVFGLEFSGEAPSTNLPSLDTILMIVGGVFIAAGIGTHFIKREMI